MNREQWKRESFLDRMACGRRVIAYDCRGHGLSDKPEGYTLEDHVSDLLGLMDALGIGKTHVLGHSMGSYIAQGAAIRSPERFAKLLLITPRSNGVSSSIEKILADAAAVWEALDAEGKLDFLNRLMVHAPEARRKYPDLLRTTLTGAQEKADLAALRGFDFRHELPKVTAKTLVVAGRHDRLNPPAEAKVCADLVPGARYVEMRRSGHVPLVEEPDYFYAFVDEFLCEP